LIRFGGHLSKGNRSVNASEESSNLMRDRS
jgi:hypothetical protein